MNPTVKYDSAANAIYVRFSEKVLESEEAALGIVLGYDENGRIVGMEFRDARKSLPPEMLTQAA